MLATKRIEIEALARLSGFWAITPSWDGSRLAFYSDKTGTMELFLMDLQTGESKQLTHGEGPKAPRAGLLWTRDNQSIIFTKDNDGDEQHNVFIINVETGVIRQLVNNPKSQDNPVDVSLDNQSVLVESTKTGQVNLHLLTIEQMEWTQITDFNHPVSGVGFSPDGSWIAFNTNETENYKNSDGYLVSSDGTDVKRVFRVTDKTRDNFVDWHPDGKQLAVSSDVDGTTRAGVYNLETSDVRWFSPLGVDEMVQGFSKDGEWLVVLRNRNSSLQPVLYRVSSGEERVLGFPAGVVASAKFVDSSTVLVQFTTPTTRMELVAYDLESGQMTSVISADYGELDKSAFVDAEHVFYPSFDGKMVPAILYKPAHLEPGEVVPAVVAVHGGPTWQWLLDFDTYAQLLVNRGYVVLLPNVRGSTGYGVEWRDTNIRDWGGGDLEDVAYGVEFLKTLGCVDVSRVGIWGGSYGGYLTYISVARKPELFKAGAPIVGITDLHLLHEEDGPALQYYLRQQMGDPVADHDLWRERSAVTYADKIQAKLLIVHGVNDPRCPISQARTFREALLSNGKTEGTTPENDFEYIEFTDEGHGSGADYEQKLRHMKLIVEFFERTL